MQDTPHITALLNRARQGDRSALDDLIQLLYAELHRLARLELRRDRQGHTLQPTALVNEAFIRMFSGATPVFAGRAHFLGIAARVMRQVLVDYARSRGRKKRDGGFRTEFPVHAGASPLTPDLLEIDQALERLADEDPRLVSLLEMRFFAGMTAEETAEARAESVHAIRHDLRYAQARLRQILDGSEARPL
jgi:RNA polymerase sigma factor (TIGR02999 family)